MTGFLQGWVRGRPVAAFYVLAFALTWLGWAPQAAYSHGLFPFDSPLFYILGGAGPLLAVFLVHWAQRGSLDAGEIFRPYLRWRVGPGWYALALFGYPALWMASLALRGEMRAGLTAMGPPAGWLPVFGLSFLAAVPEQVAWRGFALPRLQARWNALLSSLIVGGLWALWHLPLLLNASSVMSTYPLIPYLLYVVAVAVIYTWIFNSTRGSLLIVTLFHAASNTVGPFAGMEQTLVFALAAAVLVAVFGPGHLCRAGLRPVHAETAAAPAPAR